MEIYFSIIGNLEFQEDIGIPTGIDTAPFWTNLLLCLFELKCVKNLISLGSPRTYKYHGTGQFIDDPWALMTVTNSPNLLRIYSSKNVT